MGNHITVPSVTDALRAQIKEARAKVALYANERQLATEPPAKALAGARTKIWQSHLDTLLAKQSAFRATTSN